MRALKFVLLIVGQIGLYSLRTVLQECMASKLRLRTACIGTSWMSARKLLRLLFERLRMFRGHVIVQKLRGARLIGTMIALVFEGPIVLHFHVHTDRAYFSDKVTMGAAREAILRLGILLKLGHSKSMLLGGDCGLAPAGNFNFSHRGTQAE